MTSASINVTPEAESGAEVFVDTGTGGALVVAVWAGARLGLNLPNPSPDPGSESGESTSMRSMTAISKIAKWEAMGIQCSAAQG